MQKYGFVYIWRDRKHKRYYIGCHWGTETDGYICSSAWMRKAYKRRPKDFKRRILSRIYSCRQELLDEEFKYLQKIKDEKIKSKYYNLTKIQRGHWSVNKNKSVAKKISASLTGRKLSEEHKKAMKAGHKKRKDSGIPNGNLGRKISEEHRLKITGKIPWNKGLSKEDSRVKSYTEKSGKSRIGIKKPSSKIRAQRQVICPHCFKIGAEIIMNRWHFDKCKEIK